MSWRPSSIPAGTSTSQPRWNVRVRATAPMSGSSSAHLSPL
jgi:hypothetical protein